MSRPQTQNWWEALYDENLVAMFLEQTSSQEIDATLDFLTDQLDLGAGARVFDQCCGNGRLSLPLARRGFQVVGVDQATSYIGRAREQAGAEGLDVELHAADAFAFVPDKPCEAVINWWTSFGYGPDDATNTRMFERAFDALAPGGRFMLDFCNFADVLGGFQRHSVTRHATPAGETVLIRESELDLAGGALKKRWTYFLPDGRRVVHDSRVCIYLPHTLAGMLQSSGFEDVQLFGSVAGEPLSIDSPRCILRGTRPTT